MANLLRLIVDLAEDASTRAAFRDDPEQLLVGLDDLTGEDVDTAMQVAAIQVAPQLRSQFHELSVPRDPDAAPRAEALATLSALCEALELAGIISFPTSVPRLDDTVAPDDTIASHPPERTRPPHLRAVDGAGGRDDDSDDDDEIDWSDDLRAHPSHAPLTPVPDPPGGFEFGVLELVVLPDGLPESDIEPGAVGTVVAVHRQPSLGYEIEISGEDGGRRFLGVVPPSAIAPVAD